MEAAITKGKCFMSGGERSSLQLVHKALATLCQCSSVSTVRHPPLSDWQTMAVFSKGPLAHVDVGGGGGRLRYLY